MIRTNCIHFKGEKPCRFGFPCDDCSQFEPITNKILIIKCRAQGDVLRTTALLPGLKRKYPKSTISWVVDEESTDLLADNPLINRMLPLNLEHVLPLLVEKFDVVISLDKEPSSISLATKVQAVQKLGFGANEHGRLTVFNKAAEYAFRLGMDDNLKFKLNKKTYQEIISELAEVEYKRDEYVFCLNDAACQKAEEFFRRKKITRNRISVGLNTGAGTKFETKQWPKQNFIKLIHLLTSQSQANVFLLGGPREKELNREIEKEANARVYNTGTDNSLLEFAGFVSLLDVAVCSDTLAMHLAIALKKKVVALFGPTCPDEIDLYGRGVKLFSRTSCAPCYKQTCEDGRCMKDIPAEEVFDSIKALT